jgi:hypothetical protein
MRINSAVSDPARKAKSSSISGPTIGDVPGIERIAPAYNAASTIEVEVVAGHAAEFNFDAKSK